MGGALGVGVGLGPAGLYRMVSTGGLALSRVSKRFAVRISDSSPNTNHPKLLAGSSSHDCTSARICDELHVYTPTGPTDWVALAAAEKSPPSVVQKIVSRNGAAMWHRWSWPGLRRLLLRCHGCSFPPVCEQLVDLDSSSGLKTSSRHVQAQGHAENG